MTRPRLKISAGTRFGSWTVRDNTVTNKHRMSQVVAECDCGRWAVIIAANLRNGLTTQCHICASRHKLEEGKGPTQKLSVEDVQAIRTAMRSGRNTREVAEQFGVSTPTVLYIDRGMTWEHLPWPKGLGPRLHPLPKGAAPLQHDDVVVIKQMLRDKVMSTLIAAHYGVSPQTISKIKLGRIWRDVP